MNNFSYLLLYLKWYVFKKRNCSTNAWNPLYKFSTAIFSLQQLKKIITRPLFLYKYDVRQKYGDAIFIFLPVSAECPLLIFFSFAIVDIKFVPMADLKIVRWFHKLTLGLHWFNPWLKKRENKVCASQVNDLYVSTMVKIFFFLMGGKGTLFIWRSFVDVDVRQYKSISF